MQSKNENPIQIHVVGEVKNPGLYPLPRGSRVKDALDTAGGITGGADMSTINLARVLHDGEQLKIPSNYFPDLV